MRRLLLLALVALVSCTPELVIVHTNDTHSHLDPVDGGAFDGMGGAVRRAAFVDSVRLANGDGRVLLLHAGDFFQGTPYFSEFDGEAEIDVINAMRYDCVCLGNHEFDNGMEFLRERLEDLECPVVCCNYDFSDTPLTEVVKPCVVICKNDVKVGIIGLLTTLEGNVKASGIVGLKKLDDVSRVNECVRELQGEGCGMIVLLTHIGFDNDCALVPLCHGVDVVVGGHSHTFLDKPTYVRNADGKKVPVVTDGCWGVRMGLLNCP